MDLGGPAEAWQASDERTTAAAPEAVVKVSTSIDRRETKESDESSVVDGDAIYYLATIRHANEEVHRINIDARVQASSGVKAASTNLKITQKLYWSE